MKPAVATLAGVIAAGAAACGSESYTPTPGDPRKPTRACIAVDEATPPAMSPGDRRACETTLRGWYAETWYERADPADRYQGDAQLEYLRDKAKRCIRTADSYGVRGKERWTVVMRCLVVVRKR